MSKKRLELGNTKKGEKKSKVWRKLDLQKLVMTGGRLVENFKV